MKKMKKKNKIERMRCAVCGRFISYKSEIEESVIQYYIPDIACSIGNTYFVHKDCESKRKRKVL